MFLVSLFAEWDIADMPYQMSDVIQSQHCGALRILMASDLSDDVSVSAPQKPCNSDINLQKVVPKRKRQHISLQRRR